VGRRSPDSRFCAFRTDPMENEKRKDWGEELPSDKAIATKKRILKKRRRAYKDWSGIRA